VQWDLCKACSEDDAVNKKQSGHWYDDTDDEDYALLGSRFARVVQSHGKRDTGRGYRQHDPDDRPNRRIKPQPYRDRSY